MARLLIYGFGLTLFLLLGCSYPDRGNVLERTAGNLGLDDSDTGFDPPKMRFGVMPFDAWYSPLNPLGLDDLGRHAYVDADTEGDRGLETSRGTLYAAEAGFLDIAHIRNAIDLTRFAFDHVAASLYRGETQLTLIAAEPDVYRVTLSPPAAWTKLDERGGVDPQTLDEVREASIQIAGRLSYLMTTWHEVLTAFGYKGLGVITEKPSAFSYDDAVSHRVGVEAAMRALRLNPNLAEFDETVTATLLDVLKELGTLPPEQVVERAQRSEGVFHNGVDPTLKVVDLGMDGRPLVAHLIDEGIEPRAWDW
ncbi:MAG: DUF4056 domain-containing protein, partial [Planctomycetota bacterium]